MAKFKIITIKRLFASKYPQIFTHQSTLTKPNRLNDQLIIQTYQQRFSTIKNDKPQNIDEKNRILTIPNGLTTFRILSIPFINYFVLIDQHEYACALFFIAGFTDYLDGYIARNWKNQRSYLGSILDPLADKLLIGSLTIALTINNMLPIELALIILARDVSLILISLYVRYKSLEKPVTFSKFVNVKKYSSIQIEADYISKFNTLLQLALITFTLPANVFGYIDSDFLFYFRFATGFTTILSSISYLYKGGSYKIVKK